MIDPASPVTAVCDAIVEAASGISPWRIPLAVTQWDVMGARAELLTSGLSRFDRLASVVRRFLTAHCRASRDIHIEAAALAVVGAAAAGAGHWASAGIERGDLGASVSEAVAPVRDGFGRVLE